MTPTQRKAMEQALEKLKAIASGEDYGKLTTVIDEVSAALAEQPAEQAPVAWIDGSDLSLMMRYGRGCIAWGTEQNNAKTPLYTAPQPAIPPGYKLVPVEPSIAACINGSDAVDRSVDGYQCAAIYRAMLNAAPTPPAPAVEGETK